MLSGSGKIGSVVVGLVLVVVLVTGRGGVDATAEETLYLPVGESCPFAGDEAFELGARLVLGEEGMVESDDALFDEEDEEFDEGSEYGARALTGFDEVEEEFAVGAVESEEGMESERIELNRATAEELMSLPGIGPAMAERILEYREARSFTTIHQLQRVRGIGPATMEKIAHRVYVE